MFKKVGGGEFIIVIDDKSWQQGSKDLPYSKSQSHFDYEITDELRLNYHKDHKLVFEDFLEKNQVRYSSS